MEQCSIGSSLSATKVSPTPCPLPVRPRPRARTARQTRRLPRTAARAPGRALAGPRPLLSAALLPPAVCCVLREEQHWFAPHVRGLREGGARSRAGCSSGAALVFAQARARARGTEAAAACHRRPLPVRCPLARPVRGKTYASTRRGPLLTTDSLHPPLLLFRRSPRPVHLLPNTSS